MNEVSEIQQIVGGAPTKDKAWIMNYHDGAHYPVYILGKRPRSGWWKCGVIGEVYPRIRFDDTYEVPYLRIAN